MDEVGAGQRRKVLVVVDETTEADRALLFAAHGVRRNGGTLLLLSVIEPPGFHGLGVEDVLRAEALDAAERMLDTRLSRLRDLGELRTETVIREGRPADEIEALLLSDPAISALVLAAGVGGEGPGPLVSYFAQSSALAVPLTIVPSALKPDAFALLA